MNKPIQGVLLTLFVTLVMATAYLNSQDYRPIIFPLAKNSVAEIVAATQADRDDFKLLFCGTGSPNRSKTRGQPCTALIANGKLFLFDAGEGAIGKLSEYQAPTGQLHGIFLSHLHSDHISGVAEVLHNTWLYGRHHSVEIVGPPGTKAMVQSFESAYSKDLHERVRVVGRGNLNIDTAFGNARNILIEGTDTLTVYDQDGLTIKAFLVDHPDWPHAYGYRIEHKGKVIVISGDTSPSEGILRHAKGADILIHEALNSEIFEYIGTEMEHQNSPMSKERIELITKVHTTTLDLAAMAEKIGVQNLVITHLIPAMPANFVSDRFFTSGMSEFYNGKIIVARDGQYLEVLAL